MPANLPPHYHVLEKKLRGATDPADKLAILEEMLALLPKHKGTDKMHADLKKRIAKLRKGEGGPQAGKSSFSHHVDKEGAGQVCLVGAPNAGKSALVGALTRADPEVADYPFATRKPLPGMMDFHGVGIQLVDLPPLSREYMEQWVPQVSRYADALLIVVDLGDDASLDGLDEVLAILDEAKIAPVAPGKVPEPEDRDVSLAYIPTLVVGTKTDQAGADERLEVLKELYPEPWPFVTASVQDEASLEVLKKAVYDQLELLRVYSKMPGKEADKSRPFALHRGDRLEDFAHRVHKDFAQKLSFARVWGKEAFDGQRVNRDYVLNEEDVIELHM